MDIALSIEFESAYIAVPGQSVANAPVPAILKPEAKRKRRRLNSEIVRALETEAAEPERRAG